MTRPERCLDRGFTQLAATSLGWLRPFRDGTHDACFRRGHKTALGGLFGEVLVL
jgi:hypothetical protein